MQDFRGLTIWQRAHDLVLEIYKTSNDLPSSENFGLVLNLRRSAVFIAQRIAAGAGSDSQDEFVVELRKARAMCHELEYLLLVCRDLGFMKEERYHLLATEGIEVRKMISGFMKKLTGGR